MVIHKYKSIEDKGRQQWCMVYDCKNHWSLLNNFNYSHYTNVMNMKIHNVKAAERKGDQQWKMIIDCIDQWRRVNKSYPYYTNVMNMKTYRYNNEHHYFVSLTYHIKLNKW